ncbi:unnamed protein product [Musa acuminata subsp. burmannicoides]
MGFDNECILNIQSLPGEYFCPVCRTLIYPNEALQSQCTHLYCKPCLAYVVATTHACPYDGYLVTEADSKPLIESNKALAETIGKVAVYCLYHRSGCQWQGTLSECIAHCTGCTFGNSPVVCNRCGTQIIHRQVQEHTQICPGLQPQAQQADSGQGQASTTSNQAVSQDPAVASSAVPATTTSTATASTTSTTTAATATPAATATATAPATVPIASATTTTPVGASQGQANATAYAQAVAQASTPQQWYQQQQLQYQQYYQMYPGYDAYQQHYQQYAQYQQQGYPQYPQPQMQVVPQNATQGQSQPASYVQPQPHLQTQPYPQPQTQAPAQPLPQPQPQAQATQVQLQQQQPPVMQAQQQPLSQPQPQPQPQPQLVQLQAQQPHTPGQQPYAQAHTQTNQLPQAQIAGQQFGQPPQSHYPQPQPQPQPQSQPQVQSQQQMQAPPYQQSLQPQQHLQSVPHQQSHPHVQPQARPTAIQQPPMQLQPHSQYPSAHPQSQSQPMAQPQHPLAHAVTGHQSYQQPQMLQQTQPGTLPQRPMLMQPPQQGVPQQHPVQLPNQFAPQQPPRMPPPSGYMPMQGQQQSMLHTQRPPASHPQQQPPVPLPQHAQHLHQHPGVHAQTTQQGLPPQQSHGHLHPGQQFPQGMLSSQQQLPPQVPPHMQQHVSVQMHPQQNVPPAHGLATHQAQAVAIRPTIANNGMPHQSIEQFPGGPGKPAQPPLNQQLPSQSHLAWPGTNLAATYESQRSHLPQTGSQGSSKAVSTALHSGVVDKVGHAPDPSSDLAAKNAEGSGQIERSETAITKIPEVGLEADKEKAGGEFKEKDIQAEVESTLIHGRKLDSYAEEENVELTEPKLTMKEELAELSEDGSERSNVPKDGHAEENQSAEGKPDEKAGGMVEVQGAKLSSDDNAQLHAISTAVPRESFGLSEGQTAGDVTSKTHPPHQLTSPSSDKGQQQQLAHQRAPPSIEEASFLPAYHDKNTSQLAWQGPGSGMPQGIPTSGSLTGKEGYPTQHLPYSHPLNVPVTNPRYQVPDRILPHHMPLPGPIPDRRPQDAPPYQMQVPGQNMASGQMRPPGHSFPEPNPRQGHTSIVQDPLRPPSGQPYGGSYHSDVPQGTFPGLGLPTTGRGPGHVGFSQHGFPEQGISPQGQGRSHLPLPHAGTRVSHGEALTQLPLHTPHSGAFNTSNPMMSRGPFHPEDRGGPSHLGPANALEAESYDVRRPGFSDLRQPDPLVQSNVIKANGIPVKVQVDGMRDSSFSHGLPEDRFRPLPDERFRSLPDNGMPRPFPLDPGRHNVGRREFEEDLKQFPRPSQLDCEGMRKFDNYIASSRPIDRGWQQVGSDALPRPYDRSLPGPDGIPRALPATQLGPFQAGNAGPFPASGAGSEHRMIDIVETRRPAGFREEFGAISDLHKPILEFGRRMDVVPSARSPVREFGGLSSSKFGSGSGSRGIPDVPRSFRMEQLDLGRFPGSIRKDLDGNIHMHPGEQFGRGRISIGDPILGGSYGRDFANEAGLFSTFNPRSEMEVFELLKKRKPGTMGWCRICSIDCETVEGLDLHAQTREHQKMAMDMVFAIKKENNKKQRVSEGILPLEDSKKSRKDFGKPLK